MLVKIKMGLLFTILALGPSAFFYSLAYLLRNPKDWTGPALLLPLSLFVTVITQALNLKRIHQEEHGDLRVMYIAVQVGSIALGLIVGFMTYFVLLK